VLGGAGAAVYHSIARLAKHLVPVLARAKPHTDSERVSLERRNDARKLAADVRQELARRDFVNEPAADLPDQRLVNILVNEHAPRLVPPGAQRRELEGAGFVVAAAAQMVQDQVETNQILVALGLRCERVADAAVDTELLTAPDGPRIHVDDPRAIAAFVGQAPGEEAAAAADVDDEFAALLADHRTEIAHLILHEFIVVECRDLLRRKLRLDRI